MDFDFGKIILIIFYLTCVPLLVSLSIWYIMSDLIDIGWIKYIMSGIGCIISILLGYITLKDWNEV